jgi:hypothetical protein
VKRIHFSLALPKWHEWLIYITIGLLTLTGAVWLALDRFGKVNGEFGPEPNPALPWLLAAHGIGAYAVLIIASMVVPVHIRLGWNARKNRWSGALVAGTGIFLALTGLLLYYASEEGLRAAASLLHWVIGLGLPVLLAWHVIRGKSSNLPRG